jgi:hypothetical protein
MNTLRMMTTQISTVSPTIIQVDIETPLQRLHTNCYDATLRGQDDGSPSDQKWARSPRANSGCQSRKSRILMETEDAAGTPLGATQQESLVLEGQFRRTPPPNKQVKRTRRARALSTIRCMPTRRLPPVFDVGRPLGTRHDSQWQRHARLIRAMAMYNTARVKEFTS